LALVAPLRQSAIAQDRQNHFRIGEFHPTDCSAPGALFPDILRIRWTCQQIFAVGYHALKQRNCLLNPFRIANSAMFRPRSLGALEIGYLSQTKEIARVLGLHGLPMGERQSESDCTSEQIVKRKNANGTKFRLKGLGTVYHLWVCPEHIDPQSELR
jgi:hypothetical protein